MVTLVIKVSVLIISIIILSIVIKILTINFKLKRSQYKSISGNGLWDIIGNKGNYGEFLTFTMIEKIGESKILTNVYLPKKDGNTTEVDLVMITTTGIYVFESKNFSGWIFGDEKRKLWTQCLKGGRKIKFFNPIWQNKGHITALDNYLNNEYSKNFYSYIVFSERCDIKKLNLTSSNVFVMKRNYLISTLKNHINTLEPIFTPEQVEDIYSKIKTQTLVDDSIKQMHIKNIKGHL